MIDTRIPVTIITGFLGAGKTTLLNNLIKKYPQKKFAIIENEFGEIGIDGGLIVSAKENIFELSNGCICCTLNDDFFEVLEKLLDSDHVFNHLLIETTGIADPMTIVKAFISNENIQQQFRLDSVVCLADALNMTDLIDAEPEVRKQLALSDFVLLNKTESIEPSKLNEQIQLIQRINPMAQVFSTSFANVNEIEVLDTNAYSSREIEKTTLAFQNLRPLKGTENGLKHEISSVGFAIPGSFEVGKFSLWMQNFLYFNKDTMFRVKGIISFSDIPEKYIFHSIRGTYMFEPGEEWNDSERFSKIVFIGKNINRDTLEENLFQLLDKSIV